VQKIFGNIESILNLAREFSRELQSRLVRPVVAGTDGDTPTAECVGAVFVAFADRFKQLYPDYVVEHDVASAHCKELLERDTKVGDFFRAQLSADDAELNSLDTYLIKPVQRVFKYPLLLAELLRYTPPSHTDYASLEEAERRLRELVVSARATHAVQCALMVCASGVHQSTQTTRGGSSTLARADRVNRGERGL
jgi:hypothetical protein